MYHDRRYDICQNFVTIMRLDNMRIFQRMVIATQVGVMFLHGILVSTKRNAGEKKRKKSVDEKKRIIIGKSVK